MAKQDTWQNVQNLSLTLRLNDTTEDGYFGVTVMTNAQAVSDAGGIRDIQKITRIGQGRATKFTTTELANLIKGSNNSTGNFLLGELTAVFKNAIGE